VLDELDAPLDDANIGRFVTMLRHFSGRTQFVVITHNKRTMEAADRLYGVTMPTSDVSKIVSVKLTETGAELMGEEEEMIPPLAADVSAPSEAGA
jgi:chromosome segregation protein